MRKVRGDHLICYSLQIEKSDLILFFEQVLKKTDYLNSSEEYYNIFMNNCTSVLWKIVSFTF
ncbi:MAG: hypothetical protein LBI53_05180 [Candidatus Peribacteria bacterium]|nr:hypothetical protein [Candidatus Peribacteria bacterium]